MKKYLIGILIVAIIAFLGVGIFKNQKVEETNTNNVTNVEDTTNATNTENKTDTENTENKVDVENKEITEIKTGEELLEKAEKTLTARGWAGASNNVIGIKDKVAYYYNKGTGEFKKIATGIEDIYYNEDNPEEIILKKGENAEIISNELVFLIYR